MGSDLREQLQATLSGTYVVERELGGGGMSRVFVATETALDRRVVIKLLSPELVQAVSVERFRREILTVAKLSHPHIVPVLSTGSSDGLPYFTMPYLPGETLRARLVREGALPVRDVIAILRDVTQALAYAHAQGVVHRDIKPENILSNGGVSTVTDFGVAKAISAAGGGSSNLTSVGLALGTPAYMAPEQGSADPLTDQRADLYALGAVGYEMLCGTVMFPGKSPQQTLVAHAVQEPKPIAEVRPEVPSALVSLVMRCLAKDPAQRPASANEVLADLETILSGGTVANRVPRRRVSRAVLGGVGAAAVTVLLAVFIVRSVARSKVADPAAGTVRSVAVLPFENTGGNKENEYFSDGMSEELITELSKVPGLRVAARTSAFAFKGKNADIREIGQKLNVGAILEGSVRQAGNRLRVSARLVDVANGYQLWAEEYERPSTDVFAVQDEVTRAIVGALRIELSSSGSAAIGKRATTNVEAYALYLKGRYFYERRTEADLRQAVDAFEQAIRADSLFAPAYAGLSDAYGITAVYSFQAPKLLFPKARAAALRALELDSLLPEAHNALGFINVFFDYDFPAAEREFARALALNPRFASARLFRSWNLLALGRPADALREIELARTDDPLSLIINTRVGSMLYFNQRYDEAAAQLNLTVQLDSTSAIAHAQLARIYLRMGRCTDAQREARLAHSIPYGYEGGVIGVAAALCGDRAEAERTIAQLTAIRKQRFVSGEAIAQVYAALGNKDKTIYWLEQGYEDRAWALGILNVAPVYDFLRSDPRFQALVRKMKLGNS